MRASHAVLLAIACATGCSNSSLPPLPSPPATSAAASSDAEPTPSRTVAERIAALEGMSGSTFDALERGDGAALVEAGEAALPALIDCFENDPRVTELTDGDPMHRARLDVSTLCLRIAEAILDEPGLAYREAGERHAAASALRKYVARYGAMKPAARRLAILTDATTSDAAAAVAATWLTTSGGPLDVESSLDYVGRRRQLGPMRGRELRDDPAVDLVGAMLPRATRASGAGHGREACDLAGAIMTWDARAEPRLLPLGRACLASGCPCMYAFVALVAHDDPAAAVRALDERGHTLLASDAFSRARGVEVAAALDVPAVRRFVEGRLAAIDVDAALRDALGARPPAGLTVLLYAWSRAGLVPARAALERALADATPFATLVPDPGTDGARVDLPRASYTLRLPEPVAVAASLRAADLAASSLALEAGVPFSLGWPVARRDAAIAEIRAGLGAR
ncbi:MAG: hypothetical protein HY908_34635 [Myxococcales bacterium]|nr:hypothetical protein [Myxococcales bacterium]